MSGQKNIKNFNDGYKYGSNKPNSRRRRRRNQNAAASAAAAVAALPHPEPQEPKPQDPKPQDPKPEDPVPVNGDKNGVQQNGGTENGNEAAGSQQEGQDAAKPDEKPSGTEKPRRKPVIRFLKEGEGDDMPLMTEEQLAELHLLDTDGSDQSEEEYREGDSEDYSDPELVERVFSRRNYRGIEDVD